MYIVEEIHSKGVEIIDDRKPDCIDEEAGNAAQQEQQQQNHLVTNQTKKSFDSVLNLLPKKKRNIAALLILVPLLIGTIAGGITYLVVRSNIETELPNSTTSNSANSTLDYDNHKESKQRSGLLIEFFKPMKEEPISKNLVQDDFESITTIDIQAYIDSKLAEGNTYIQLPPGRHYIAPKPPNPRTHLVLQDLVNITIDGGGETELICTQTTRALFITNCTNLTMKGFSIDYDPLPYTQGVITSISDDKLELTVRLLKGYPNPNDVNDSPIFLKSEKIEIYSPDRNDELATRTYFGVSFEYQNNGSPTVETSQLIVKKNPSEASRSGTAHERVGNIVVIDTLNIEATSHSDPHAVAASHCDSLVLQDVTVFASNSFGFYETDSTGSTYTNCSVDRRSPQSDITQREYRRLRSANADGFHSKHAYNNRGPTYQNCTARYNGDDGFAINGHYHLISRIIDDTVDTTTLRVIGKMGKLPNFELGDEVELVNYNGKRIEASFSNNEDAATTAAAKIIAFDTTGFPLDSTEIEFLNRQTFHGTVKQTRRATKAYHVTLDRPILLPNEKGEMALPMGSLIASANRVGNGFQIKDCIIGPTRSRGVVVKAGQGIISNNYIRDTWGQGIMLAPVYGWLESGSGSHLLVENNLVERSHDVGIAVYSFGGDGTIAPAGAHSDVTVQNNEVWQSSLPAIAITSTMGLSMSNNRIRGEDRSEEYLFPHQRNKFGRREDPGRQVYLKNIVMK